jgi:hypothetical protein
MQDVSRRTFLTQASMAAAIAGVGASLPIAASRAGATDSAPSGQTELLPTGWRRRDEPVVAHLKDAASGEISLYVGTRHITVRDRALAARLARAAT